MATSSAPSAYFSAIGEGRYRATESTAGAWDPRHQHIAPAMGLMTHALELSHDPQRPLSVSRLSFDIYGAVPVGEVEISTDVVRSGRTIELSEVTLTHADRTIAVMRAWSVVESDTADLMVTPQSGFPSPDECEPWDAAEVWPGEFIASLEGRRRYLSPGRAQAWLRTDLPLTDSERSSDFARCVGLIDVANGITLAVDPRSATYPNVDSTVSFFRQPRGEWVGLDVTASIGPEGAGLTHSVLHDTEGPVGMLTQSLTVRRMPPAP